MPLRLGQKVQALLRGNLTPRQRRLPSALTDDRCLRSPQRVRAIFTLYQANPRYPFIDKPGVLAGAEVTIVINPAWKDVIAHRAATLLEPGQQTGPGIGKQFELDRATCLLLHHDSPRSNLSTTDNVANFHLHEVAATELTVDRKVEECTISQAASLIEVKSDLPNLLGFQCSFRADGSPGVPDLPLE